MRVQPPTATGWRISRGPWLTLVLAGLMAALFAALGPAPAGLVYDTAAIGDGQWWRLISAHLVHSDVQHLAWNLGAWLLLGTLLERISRAALAVALLLGVVAVDGALAGWLPHITHYCGLSGALNAVLLPTMAVAWRARRSPLLPVIAVLSLAKIGVEAWFGSPLFTDTAWTSVPLVHLAGWLAGTLPVAWLLVAAAPARPEHGCPKPSRRPALPAA